MIPQLLFVIIIAMSIGIALAKHGKPSPKYNFWLTLLASAIWYAIAWSGGFFDGIIK